MPVGSAAAPRTSLSLLHRSAAGETGLKNAFNVFLSPTDVHGAPRNKKGHKNLTINFKRTKKSINPVSEIVKKS